MNPLYHQIATDIVLFLISACVGIYLYLSRKSQVTILRLDAVEKELKGKLSQQVNTINRLSERLTEVEVSRPTLEKLSKSVGQVHNRIDETKTLVSRLEGEFQASNRTLGLIHEYLLNKEKP